MRALPLPCAGTARPHSSIRSAEPAVSPVPSTTVPRATALATGPSDDPPSTHLSAVLALTRLAMVLRAGDVLRVTRQASAQFTVPMLFRVIRPLDCPTYHGWTWLDGYQLDAAGDAVERRSIFVRIAGLQRVELRRAQAVPRGR